MQLQDFIKPKILTKKKPSHRNNDSSFKANGQQVQKNEYDISND